MTGQTRPVPHCINERGRVRVPVSLVVTVSASQIKAMKSTAFLTALFTGLTLSMTACQPVPRLSEQQLASCAIYEAALLEFEAIFAETATGQPIVFAFTNPNLVLEDSPDWDEWNPALAPSQRAGEITEITLDRDSYVELSICPMARLTDWQRIQIDQHNAAWMLPPSPEDNLVEGFTLEFALSRIYVNSDRDYAVIRIEPARLSHADMTDPFDGHAAPVTGHMRLERGSDGEWTVTGHHPYRR